MVLASTCLSQASTCSPSLLPAAGCSFNLLRSILGARRRSIDIVMGLGRKLAGFPAGLLAGSETEVASTQVVGKEQRSSSNRDS